MPPDFDDQLRRLLRQQTDDVRPTRDVLSQVKRRLNAPARNGVSMRANTRFLAFPVIASATAIVLVALFATLFATHFRQPAGTTLRCPAVASPTAESAQAVAPSNNGVLEMKHAYVGDDFISLDMNLIRPAGWPEVTDPLPHQFYVRDADGQYVTDSSFGVNSTVPTPWDVTLVFPGFAHPRPAGEATFYLGWDLADTGDLVGRLSPAHELAFKAMVVTGETLHPAVKPATSGKVTLDLVNMTITKTPEPIVISPAPSKFVPDSQLSRATESVRLHLRLHGLPPATACNTQVSDTFDHVFLSGNPLRVDLGLPPSGDQSTLTFPDGTSVRPVFANVAGHPDASLGAPAQYTAELEPGNPGDLDVVVVFFTTDLPHIGTLNYSLTEARAKYLWKSSPTWSYDNMSQDVTANGPWTLTIPLS